MANTIISCDILCNGGFSWQFWWIGDGPTYNKMRRFRAILLAKIRPAQIWRAKISFHIPLTFPSLSWCVRCLLTCTPNTLKRSGYFRWAFRRTSYDASLGWPAHLLLVYWTQEYVSSMSNSRWKLRRWRQSSNWFPTRKFSISTELWTKYRWVNRFGLMLRK